MAWKRELAAARERWNVLTFYEKFEHAVVVVLTAVIALIIVFALWSLVLKVVVSILESSFDPTDYSVFQALFGMIFTVIIALEFKRSLLVVAERRQSIVQVRTVILLALLAVVRKIMIVDLASTESLQLLALAATILALGVAYWLVTNRERVPRTREP